MGGDHGGLTDVEPSHGGEQCQSLRDVRKIFESFMSPGSVTEKLHFLVAEYEPDMKIGDGGGLRDEGEDIEVIEPTIDEALAMIANGRIVDGKTIMLLQYAALNIFR